MPLYRGRKSLQRALQLLKKTSGNKELVPPEEGTALRNYYDLVTGKRTITRTREEGSKPQEMLFVKLRPFAIRLIDSTSAAYPVNFSKRANEALKTFFEDAKALNHIDDEKIEFLDKQKGYTAATVTIFNPGTGVKSVTAANNKGLGVAYKTRNGKSYTFPFGANNVNDNQAKEIEVRQDILTAVLKKTPKANVSFKQEKWK